MWRNSFFLLPFDFAFRPSNKIIMEMWTEFFIGRGKVIKTWWKLWYLNDYNSALQLHVQTLVIRWVTAKWLDSEPSYWTHSQLRFWNFGIKCLSLYLNEIPLKNQKQPSYKICKARTDVGFVIWYCQLKWFCFLFRPL